MIARLFMITHFLIVAKFLMTERLITHFLEIAKFLKIARFFYNMLMVAKVLMIKRFYNTRFDNSKIFKIARIYVNTIFYASKISDVPRLRDNFQIPFGVPFVHLKSKLLTYLLADLLHGAESFLTS